MYNPQDLGQVCLSKFTVSPCDIETAAAGITRVFHGAPGRPGLAPREPSGSRSVTAAVSLGGALRLCGAVLGAVLLTVGEARLVLLSNQTLIFFLCKMGTIGFGEIEGDKQVMF